MIPFMTWLLTIIFKPFFIFAYLTFGAGCNWVVSKSLPDGKVKNFLLRRY